jgi:uncharacterized protein YqhQ
MYCKICGGKIDADAKACPACGNVEGAVGKVASPMIKAVIAACCCPVVGIPAVVFAYLSDKAAAEKNWMEAEKNSQYCHYFSIASFVLFGIGVLFFIAELVFFGTTVSPMIQKLSGENTSPPRISAPAPPLPVSPFSNR